MKTFLTFVAAACVPLAASTILPEWAKLACTCFMSGCAGVGLYHYIPPTKLPTNLMEDTDK